MALIGLSATGTARDNFAVLVGVNDYINLDRQYQSQGAANDVTLMDCLLDRRYPRRGVVLQKR